MTTELTNTSNSNSPTVKLDDPQNENRSASRTAKGLKWLMCGAVLGFLSCVCSICNPIESFYYVNLYGVSSIAITMAFYGLYLIFE
jgi:hypothetical protein